VSRLKTLHGARRAVTCTDFTHNNNYVLGASADNNIYVWNYAQDRVVVRTFFSFSFPFCFLMFSSLFLVHNRRTCWDIRAPCPRLSSRSTRVKSSPVRAIDASRFGTWRRASVRLVPCLPRRTLFCSLNRPPPVVRTQVCERSCVPPR
jgi:WD40 repeat protein